MSIELFDGGTKTVECAIFIPGRYNVHVAELLGLWWVVRIFRNHPQPELKGEEEAGGSFRCRRNTENMKQ